MQNTFYYNNESHNMRLLWKMNVFFRAHLPDGRRRNGQNRGRQAVGGEQLSTRRIFKQHFSEKKQTKHYNTIQMEERRNRGELSLNHPPSKAQKRLLLQLYCAMLCPSAVLPAVPTADTTHHTTCLPDWRQRRPGPLAPAFFKPIWITDFPFNKNLPYQ